MNNRRLKSKEKILIADDDPVVVTLLKNYVEQVGFDTICVSDGKQALDSLGPDIALVLLDLGMPKVSGLECIQFIRSHHPNIPAIVISGTDVVQSAVDAIQHGAYDYVTKPVERSDIVNRVQQALQMRQLRIDNQGLKAAFSAPMLSTGFVAQSQASQQLLKKISKVSGLESSILITGESGTGKSTAARMIHQGGPRSGGPFVTVNCASLPRELLEAELFGHTKGAFTGAVNDRPGRVEIADGGTLFLDEIGDLPLDLQPKLLTFLQDRTFQRVGSNKVRSVNVRLITATHQNLAEMCESKSFREDLYFRLNVICIHMPSLRERAEDIPEIVRKFLESKNAPGDSEGIQCTPAALNLLQKHHWRGNIRELENVLERACAFCEDGQIRSEDLSFTELGSDSPPPAAAPSEPVYFGKTLVEIEKLAIIETLRAVDGCKAEAARRLGISEKGMYNKLKRFEIDASV